MSAHSKNSQFLLPLTDLQGQVHQCFRLLEQDLPEIERFKSVQDALVLQQQRQQMSAEDFAINTMGGKYPYYGAIGGAYTYIFTPVAVGHHLTVRNGFTRHALSLASGPRRVPVDHASAMFRFKVEPEAILQWIDELNVRTDSLTEHSLAFQFTQTSLGASQSLMLATGEVKNFTDYDSW